MSNIVDAYPREGIVFRTKPLFQWDWGQIVRLHISDLPAAYKVEFSNSTRADAVSTIQTTDEVTVPAQFLESGNPVYAWVVVVDEARTTEYSLMIPVAARAKPTDLEPAPEEQTEIEQTLSALNEAVSDVQGIADAIPDTINDALEAAKESGEFDGPKGDKCDKGDTGDTGERGPQGIQGEQGIQGPKGDKGDKGDTGSQGPKGDTGATGATGPAGPKGDKGEQGPKGDPGDDYILTAADKAEIAQQAEELLAPVLDTKAPAIWEDASGSIAHFADGADDMPLRECVIRIEPVQEGTGDPSPENVRPITGWTGCRVERSGKNMLPTASYTDAKRSVIAATMDAELGRVLIGKTDAFTISGVSTAVQSDGNTISINVYYSDGTSAITVIYRGDQHVSGALTGPWAIHLTTGKTISDVHLGGTTRNAVVTLTNLQLESGFTATPYEPYQGSTYGITFPAEAGTVYGGTLDVVRGVLTVTHGMIASYAGETLPGEWISDLDVYADGTTPTTGAQVVYQLATPTTYTLTPQEIKTLLGTNNIWADTGDTAVTYPADTRMFVEQNAPESPVQDVQVNGTSILSQGVANVPLANSTTPGVVIVREKSDGLRIDSNNRLSIARPTEADLKEGNTSYRVLSPEYQHISTFYGLAKAAGADMAPSSNPVGTYTDAAKIAIQKMLGIYQAPWEVIRSDTGTNAEEADIDITVDGNGNAFELTDVRILFWLPTQQTVAKKGDYGRIFAYYSSSGADTAYCGQWEQTAGQTGRICGAEILQENNMIKTSMYKNAILNSEIAENSTLRLYPYASNNSQIWSLLSEQRIYSKVAITKVTGTYGYVIYGKRKWQ